MGTGYHLSARAISCNKGQLIALSGNTGGSAGPHLHFEIRDTKTEECLNPLLFGFNIPDSVAPIISGLYWYDRRFSTYEPGANGIAVKNWKCLHS